LSRRGIPINSEQVDVLSLLDNYSSRLSKLIDEFESTSARLSIFIFGFAFGLMIGAYIVYVSHIRMERIVKISDAMVIWALPIIIVLISISVAFLLFTLSYLYQKRRWIYFRIAVTSNALEELITLATEFLPPVDETTNRAEYLIVRIRISEARSTVQMAESIRASRQTILSTLLPAMKFYR
jgi:hypothetical protein